MLRTENSRQLSFYSSLYEKIPESHLLKKIAKAVDFSFINELLEDSYCKHFGRPAKEPEMMMKLCFLEYLYILSDVKVVEEASYNLAFLWFLGLNPEDTLPNPSLLAKFRTQRLKDISLDEVICEIVRQCVESGLIKGDGITIDTTHIEANCTKKVPERIMKHLAKRIFKGLERDNGSVPVTVNTDIPNYKQIEDHKEAKSVMQAYLQEVIVSAEAYAGENTQRAIAEAKEVLSDERFIIQKGLRSLADKDAQVGSKSKTSQFFGYKAYFRKDILDALEEKKIKGYIPVSASVYKVDEELFAYNKDSDQWFCFMGNHTVSCKKLKQNKRGKTYEQLSYLFSRQQCIACPHRDICMGKNKSKARKLQVAASAPLFYELSQEQKQPDFQKKYKKRSAQEWKNAEMKRFHAMARARGWGLRSIRIQVKLTAIAVNLKRIAALLTSEVPKKAESCTAKAACVEVNTSILAFFLRRVPKPPCTTVPTA